jgi:hypothetical protein
LLAAFLTGLVGAMILWLVVPYNNKIVGGVELADSYLPVAAVALLLLLALVVNPLLRLVGLGGYGRIHLAIIAFVLLAASVVPGSGMLGHMPYAINQYPIEVAKNENWDKAYQEAQIPARLWPDNVGYGADIYHARAMLNSLPPEEPIPWDKWHDPALLWGLLILASWTMMMGLILIVLPQWRRNERLPFPLLNVYESLVEEPGRKHLLPAMLRRKGFWIAATAVFLLHLLSGYSQYYPDAVPAVPLKWDLSQLFTEDPLRNMPGYVKRSQLVFLLFGVAFFMPGRIGFSVWFFTVGYAFYEMVGKSYTPPYRGDTIDYQRFGAMIAVSCFVIYLGRKRWAQVFLSLIGPRGGDRSAWAQDLKALLLFLVGAGGIFAWLLWANVPLLWSLVFTAFAFMATLIISRLLAETGMPFLQLGPGSSNQDHILILNLMPARWLTLSTMYFARVISVMFLTLSQVSLAAIGMHGLALDDRGGNQRRRTHLAMAVLGLLVVGLFVAGVMHLHGAYRNISTLDGRQMLGSNSAGLFHQATRQMLTLQEGSTNAPVFSGWGHMGFGAILAIVLEVLCLRSAVWPIHPAGLVLADTTFVRAGWTSIFLGWLVKVMLLRYGGARLYRAAVPVMLGAIIGEIFAGIFWTIEPAIRIWMDLPYQVLQLAPA